MSVASVLEAGGLKGSREAGVHEFTTPGLDCLDGELSLCSFATRGRISLSMTERDPQDDDLWPIPSTQLVVRGEETVLGSRHVVKTKFGQDVQRIYSCDDNVAWMELQVWVGIT